MSENNQESSITTDDLIFLIGEKETTILAKNRQIKQLNAYINTLNNKLKEYGNDEKVKELQNKIDEQNKKMSGYEEDIFEMKESLSGYKEKMKKYQDLVADNERLSRIIKEKDEQLRKLKESKTLDGESFE